MKEYRPRPTGFLISAVFGLAITFAGVYMILSALHAFGLADIPVEVEGGGPPPSSGIVIVFGVIMAAVGIGPMAWSWLAYRNARVLVSEAELRIVDFRGRERFREPWRNVKSIERISDEGVTSLKVSNGRQTVQIPYPLAGISGLEADLRSRITSRSLNA